MRERVRVHASLLHVHRLRPDIAGPVDVGGFNGQLPSVDLTPLAGIRQIARVTSLILAALGVLSQIAYPLLSGGALRVATVLSVVLLAGAGLLHAGATWGARAAMLLLVVAGGIGLAAETVGVHTGLPFGEYSYNGNLGLRLAGVPLVVPLAWAMLAYPCLVLGRRLVQHPLSDSDVAKRVIVALGGGIGLTGWDLFLDPQMVGQGNWFWAHPSPSLPGVPDVPLTNYAGWLLISVLLIAALDFVLPGTRPRSADEAGLALADELTPTIVLAWTWLGSAVGNLVFFDRPWVALYGSVAMGTVVLPYLLSLHLLSPHPGSRHPGSPHLGSPHPGSPHLGTPNLLSRSQTERRPLQDPENAAIAPRETQI